MKSAINLLLVSLTICLSGCVQKAYKKTVVFTLAVNNIKDIQAVGLRGNGKPLSWETDYPLQTVVKDSLYRVTVSTVTGYKFAEVKFTVNGEFELKNQPNRRIDLYDNDTTYYNAVFDKNQ